MNKKFKVGDKVVYQNKNANMQIGVIKFIDENGDCAIRFDPKENPTMQCGHSILSTETQFMMNNYYDLYKPDPVVEIKITANPKSRKTVVLYYEDGKLVAECDARCNPEDKWDANTGALIAYQRLMYALNRDIHIIDMSDLHDRLKELLGNIKED